MDATAFKPREVTGFLVSQVGYDLEPPKRALIRSTAAGLADGARFEARDAYNGRVYFTGDVCSWGEKWDSRWWVLDFTGLYRAGLYRLHVLRGAEELLVSDPFRVGVSAVWDATVDKVAFSQFEARAALARHGSGWKDCGSDWRECGSHTFALIGLCDLLQYGFEFMDIERQRRLAGIIRTGCGFLCQLMDKAAGAGHAAGAVAHEIPNHSLVLPGDAVSTAMALGYASRLLFDFFPGECADWLRRAQSAYSFFLRMQPWDGGGFSAINRGIEEGYVPRGFMTRDLLMALWAGLQLYSSGVASVKDSLYGLVDRILDRQIVEAEAECGYWGHFYEFDDRHHSEKANTHHHVGHDTGAVMAFNVLPLMEFCQRFYDGPRVERVRRAVSDFAGHFALPACSANPFGLLPMGVFGGKGLLDFCGPWHGANVTYGYFASMAARLAAFTGQRALLDAAVGNLQWILGLNAGVTAESMAGCVYWRETVPPGAALPVSMVLGVGHRYAGGWTSIAGTVVNGFCTNPQFTLQVPPEKENDGPWLFTDEDWIPHAGGLLSAVAVLRNFYNSPWNL